MVIETGQHLDAGLKGVEPDDQLQVQRDREEDAHQDQVLAEQPDEPGAERGDLQERQVTSGSRSLLSRRPCHFMNAQSTTPRSR